jgi:hypothetical protein
MDPQLREYLLNRYKEEEAAAQQQAQDAQLVDDLQQAGSGIGYAIAGVQKPNDNAYYAARREANQAPIKQADKSRKSAMENYSLGRQFAKDDRDDAQIAVKADPSSSESDLARQMASKLMPGKDFSGMTAAQLEAQIPTLSKMYEMDLRAQERNDQKAYQQQMLDATRGAKAQEKAEKLAKEEAELTVPGVGTAITADDAKKVKQATETKAAFDRKLQEMISLRKQYGAETLNREAVSRGNQLASDLKLLYKDLANLGVLSKSDEAIINAVIPSDPLEWNASSLVGQDPTMARLTKLKGDVAADYESQLSTRLRSREGGQNAPAAASNPGGQEDTKIVNGVAYRRVQGGWQRVK